MGNWKKVMDVIAETSLIVGGVTWGIFMFGTNLVTKIFGVGTIFTNVIFTVVGLSALWKIYRHITKK